MKFTKFVAPLLLLPSLAFAHSTEVMFNLPASACSNSEYAAMSFTLSNLSDHAANLKVQFYNKSGQEVAPQPYAGKPDSDFAPGGNFSIAANSSASYTGYFGSFSQSHYAPCSEKPYIVKIVKDKNSEVLATGWVRESLFGSLPLNINQGKAF